MKLGEKLYNWLKWICLIALPAVSVAYVGLSAVWGWPFADEVSKTVNVVCVLIGALIGISSANYYKEGK